MDKIVIDIVGRFNLINIFLFEILFFTAQIEEREKKYFQKDKFICFFDFRNDMPLIWKKDLKKTIRNSLFIQYKK